MYNGTEDPFILNFNWLTVPSPLSLPTLSLSLFLGNSKFQFKIHFKHQAFKKYIWIWNDKLKNLAGLVPQKSGLCKTWNIGFEYWNMFARAVERKIEWWSMIWVKQHSFQYCSFCLFCNSIFFSQRCGCFIQKIQRFCLPFSFSQYCGCYWQEIQGPLF